MREKSGTPFKVVAQGVGQMEWPSTRVGEAERGAGLQQKSKSSDLVEM